MKRILVAALPLSLVFGVSGLWALTEQELLGTWQLTSYLAVRETDQGSYHLVIDDSQRSPEYPLVLRATFHSGGTCDLAMATVAGGIDELSARFQKQTVDGQEFILLRLASGVEVLLTLRPIVSGEKGTLFFLSTTPGEGKFSPYWYDTFGSMQKVSEP